MTRDEVVAAMQANAVKLRKVELPGIGAVYVKSLSLRDSGDLQKWRTDDDDPLKEAKYAALLIVDEKGQRIFDPTNAGDVELLSRQPLEMLGQLTPKAEGTDNEGN